MTRRESIRWDARFRVADYVIATLFSLAAVIQVLDLVTRVRHHDSLIEAVCALVISVAVATFVAAGARRAS